MQTTFAHHTATTTTLPTLPHHLPLSPSITVAHSTAEIEPACLVSTFLAPSPLPRLTLANKVAHHHHHLIHTTSLPPLIALHCCWIQHTQNPASMLSFEIFSPQPPPLTCGLEWPPEPAPPPLFTTSYTTPPFISIGAPKTKPLQDGFRILAKNPKTPSYYSF